MTDQVLAEQRIGQNTEVTLHFALRLENGDTVDSTFDKAPATFKVGDGNLLPGFEAALFGFKAGDKRNLHGGESDSKPKDAAKKSDKKSDKKAGSA